MTLAVDNEEVFARIRDSAQRFDPILEGMVFGSPTPGAPQTPLYPPFERGEEHAHATLVEAMRYALLAPGKRLRPYLVCRCCELAGGSETAALPFAVAIECVHAFSLVHDDLPAMDDDDLRRGRPTTHVRFGEAMAILAGDALLAAAFEVIARRVPDPRLAARGVFELASAAGVEGMIGGQAADIQGETLPPDADLVRFVHERKTARLFRCACRLGAIAADADDAVVDTLGAYGHYLGLAFQIVDDLLDVTSTADRLGKGVTKDETAGKQSFPRCVGMETSRAEASACVDRALQALAAFGSEAGHLRETAAALLMRTS